MFYHVFIISGSCSDNEGGELQECHEPFLALSCLQIIVRFDECCNNAVIGSMRLAASLLLLDPVVLPFNSLLM